jgi:AraC-like DNA-binding protein
MRCKGQRQERLTCHDYWELLGVVSGNGRQLAQGRTLPLERGCLVLMPPGLPHLECSESGLELIWLGLEGEALGKFKKGSPASLAGKPQLVEKLAELWMASQLPGRRSGPELDGMALALISRFWREVSGLAQTEGGGRVEKAIGFFNDRFAEKLSIAEVAELCGLSHGRFATVFKEATGKRPLEYLESVRMRHALRLLEGTGLSLRRIAVSSGYQNEFYFSRAFKKLFGSSPDAYRRGLR